jgi:hypothetical protein
MRRAYIAISVAFSISLAAATAQGAEGARTPFQQQLEALAAHSTDVQGLPGGPEGLAAAHPHDAKEIADLVIEYESASCGEKRDSIGGRLMRPLLAADPAIALELAVNIVKDKSLGCASGRACAIKYEAIEIVGSRMGGAALGLLVAAFEECRINQTHAFDTAIFSAADQASDSPERSRLIGQAIKVEREIAQATTDRKEREYLGHRIYSLEREAAGHRRAESDAKSQEEKEQWLAREKAFRGNTFAAIEDVLGAPRGDALKADGVRWIEEKLGARRGDVRYCKAVREIAFRNLDYFTRRTAIRELFQCSDEETRSGVVAQLGGGKRYDQYTEPEGALMLEILAKWVAEDTAPALLKNVTSFLESDRANALATSDWMIREAIVVLQQPLCPSVTSVARRCLDEPALRVAQSLCKRRPAGVRLSEACFEVFKGAVDGGVGPTR